MNAPLTANSSPDDVSLHSVQAQMLALGQRAKTASVAMARAFAQAVEAGRTAFVAGMGNRSKQAQASSPLTGTLATDLGFLA